MPDCTAESPMPEVRDQMGQHWNHVGAQPVNILGYGEVRGIKGTLYRCPNCGQEFYQNTLQDMRHMHARRT